ncbi:hypothetical protein JTE90_012908 [Oedothorax gibbosus]|uniref:Constitutive coactivator of PPAR-gamma-like protein 1 n=1 Tax=Oedothorax gibbosus TaxID=931172 RepID=A0AAV6UEQ0_9ARAC|nr:hypothetical protein JTE90_012908 [Oedothorax gibbosus]
MINIELFQSFIESFCPSAIAPVDLVQIARKTLLSQRQHDYRPGFLSSPLYLLMDGECCLDRLYGGYFGDWVCGGQWNRMVDFLLAFFHVMRQNNIQITVFFNGALELDRMHNWVEKQISVKNKMAQVLRHTHHKGTPPPKVWWCAPNGLYTCLRMILRHLKVNVVLTTTDHSQEIMSHLQKYTFHGLLADNPEYLVFHPPRYFSAAHLKLTYKGTLETKEYILSEVAKVLDLHPSRICIVAALLGNHILTSYDLTEFHFSLCSRKTGEVTNNMLIESIIDYVRNQQSVDDLNEVAKKIFGEASETKCDKFKQCVAYYCRSNKKLFTQMAKSSDSSQNVLHTEIHGSLSRKSKFASETEENEISNLKSFHQVTEKAKHGAFQQLLCSQNNSECIINTNFSSKGSGVLNPNKKSFNDNTMNIPMLNTAIDALTLKHDNKNLKKEKNLNSSLPKVAFEVLDMCLERHQKGLMHPYIYQILSQGEIKIPVVFEDGINDELPNPTLFFRPMRQMIYALLFNQRHFQIEEKDNSEVKVPEVMIKEWLWTHSNRYHQPEFVPSKCLDWTVPTVSRLWFTAGPDANKTRLQAFLTCMKINSTLILDTMFVPQHFFLLCCVLRYMLSIPETPFLYKHELDAFLVQAVDSHLMDNEYTQELEVPITPRGLMLAAMFMNGVDHAIMVNDACGAPISWLMCCPWLFFDGKLFHSKLLKSNSAKNLTDLCDNNFHEISVVENMQNAILEGLNVKFPLPRFPFSAPHPVFPKNPVNTPPFPQGRGRGHQRVMPCGGQLEVAGVVVGNWGPNYGHRPKSENRSLPPHVVSVGRGIGRGLLMKPTTSKRGGGTAKKISTRGTSPQRTSDDSTSFTQRRLPRLGMGRGAPHLEGAKSEFSDLGFEI